MDLSMMREGIEAARRLGPLEDTILDALHRDGAMYVQTGRRAGGIKWRALAAETGVSVAEAKAAVGRIRRVLEEHVNG
jgi:hypothetical protein